MKPSQSALTHLECSGCGKTLDPSLPHGVCGGCGQPVLARYDLKDLTRSWSKETLRDRPATMWRYRELLPVQDEAHVVSLGEPLTPLVHAPQLGARLELRYLYVKDESRLPTGTFKARGLAMAVSRALELGLKTLAIPSAGNAAEALSAYAARAGLDCFAFMPQDAPLANQRLCRAAGARVFLVNGLIGDAGRLVRQGVERYGWFDVATFREPYRVEGKKTMGLELAEQLGWTLPEVIVYPTGGGTGLVGMWKAFEELEALGWIGEKRPRMVSVQAEGCAPVVRAFQAGAEAVEPWQDARTVAGGLRVPAPLAGRLILKTLRESGGTALAVSDAEILRAMREMSASEGLLPSPESAATWAATKRLVGDGWIKPDERAVLFSCGTLLKHVDLLEDEELPVLEPDAELDDALFA